MQLPEKVRRAVERRAEETGFAVLRRAAAAMSAAYRAGGAEAVSRLAPAERVAAYLATRMPATYAAAHMVLGEVKARLAGREVRSVLDLGGGAGAASLAAHEWFPEAEVIIVERDTALADAAREWLPDARITGADLERMDTYPEADLVVASYALGELKRPDAARMWSAARVALVAIEPGTPAGYALLMRIRGELLGAGARMLAPCPHEAPCPLPPDDWCHFGARVERSAVHRRLKGAELNYEDEKFSYVAVARDAVALPAARIIRRPEHQPGLITLQTCAPAGVTAERIAKRERDRFRAARRAAWGGTWEP